MGTGTTLPPGMSHTTPTQPPEGNVTQEPVQGNQPQQEVVRPPPPPVAVDNYATNTDSRADNRPPPRTVPGAPTPGSGGVSMRGSGRTSGADAEMQARRTSSSATATSDDAEATRDASAATLNNSRDAIINDLIDLRGTATQEDAAAVRAELARLPTSVLENLHRNGTKVVVVRGSVTEARPELAGVRPRGWPPGSTWDTVPGLFDRNNNEVVIATRNVGGRRQVPAAGNGHGSSNLVIHETMHAYDHHNNSSNSASFRSARTADQARLSAYERQAGAAGREESFAESAALYYGGGTSGRPNLDRYFRDHVAPR